VIRERGGPPNPERRAGAVALDWWWVIGIVGLAAFWVQIMMAYRRQLIAARPQSEHVEETLADLQAQIAETEEKTATARSHVASMEETFEEMDRKRKEEAARLERHQMIPIPSGEFVMGSSDGPTHEGPEHRVLLNTYLIDRYPVTNAQYKQFVDVTGYKPPPQWSAGTYPLEQAGHPVVNVSGEDACAYAEWVGKRLPTEAEWEKAARGTEGRVFPWGDAFHRDRLNSGNEVGHTTHVDKHPEGASPYGVMDMCGNVSEWTADWYDKEYYGKAPLANPAGPEGGKFKVIKGGFFGETMGGVRAACRAFFPPGSGRDNLGFRCAKTPGENPR
jgi:formylglycine-generating enzyme